MYTLVITDSRGAGIQNILQEYTDIGQTRVESHPGADLERAVRRSLPTIIRDDPCLIIIMAGICNITYRNPRTRVTSLAYHTEAEIAHHALAAAMKAQELIRNSSRAEISFATITGIDLSDYNSAARKHMTPAEYEEHCLTTKIIDPDQDLLNTTILSINRKLVALNSQNGTPTTWTAGTVHPYHNNAHHHNYRRLRDGCHAHTDTKRDWAKRIAKTIRRQNQRL